MNQLVTGKFIAQKRKEKNLTQEQLAEKVNISVTHMSHIETANTKLSLPVLVDIANVLQVQTDELLYDHKPVGATALLMQIVSECSPAQVDMIVELAKTVKNKFPQE